MGAEKDTSPAEEFSKEPVVPPVEDLAAKAGRELSRALDELGEGQAPCQDDGNRVLWFDEHADVREEAALACRTCPVLALCSAYADLHGERWGVWGGRDRQALSTSGVHRRRRAALVAQGVTS